MKLAAIPILAALALAPVPAMAPGPPGILDLSDYTATFTEDFDSLSVSAWGDGTSTWIAHTPWSGDFGDAEFSDPQEGFPFTVADGLLRIEARKGPDGKWRSGLLSADDPKERGFCQRNGYFEARMKLPPGKGVWPAFWLIGRDKTQGSPEIDVLEYYGHDTAHYRSNWHVWKSALGKADEGDGRAFDVPAGSLTDHFHTYGVDISDQYVVFYMDRKETWRINTPPSYRTCFYPLINLALGSGWPIKETPNPSFLWVDYIKVYSRTTR